MQASRDTTDDIILLNAPNLINSVDNSVNAEINLENSNSNPDNLLQECHQCYSKLTVRSKRILLSVFAVIFLALTTLNVIDLQTLLTPQIYNQTKFI
jgi:hypothetical protein